MRSAAGAKNMPIDQMPNTTKTYISRVENERLIFADLPGADLLGTTSRLKPVTKTGSKLTAMANVLTPESTGFELDP